MCSSGASPRALRIALLTHSVNPRGGVVHTLELAQALHAAGHAVTVFAPALPWQAMFRAVDCTLHLVPVQAAPGGVAGMVEARIAAFESTLATVLRHETFDVLHAQDPIGANALANLQARSLIGGFVRTVHHLDTFDDPHLAAWQTRGFTAAAQVLCVSQLWCERLRAGHGVDAALVHNGVDCARYSPVADASDARVIARHGLRSGAPLVLAVGGVEARKNTQRLVDAFALLRAERPQAQLVIAGGASLLDHDDYAAGFHARVAAAGLRIGRGEAIVLTGTVPDDEMPALFRAADVLAMPSLREGFGLAVLEALASGTPVVASRIAPFTEYLNRDGTPDCTFADPHDPADITRALRMALGTEMALVPPPVCRRFGWPQSAARHAALYRASAALGQPLGNGSAHHPASRSVL